MSAYNHTIKQDKPAYEHTRITQILSPFPPPPPPPPTQRLLVDCWDPHPPNRPSAAAATDALQDALHAAAAPSPPPPRPKRCGWLFGSGVDSDSAIAGTDLVANV